MQSALVVSAASSFVPSLAAAKAKPQTVALLLPLTGPHAALGLSMSRAAMLASNGGEAGALKLIPIDTGGTAQGARTAARTAVKRGAKLILGPVFAPEVRAAVEGAAGRVPVIAFSNDAALRESGAFLIGITPSQATGAILRYARSRGIRSIGTVASGDAWALATTASAEALEGELGLDVTAIDIGALAAASGLGMPDALLLPGTADSLAEAARTIGASGPQLLGTFRAIDSAPASLAALAGVWVAGPDPKAFGDFARRYQSLHGGRPGAIGALAYDAAAIARSLAAAGQLNRAGLLSQSGFTGVAGAVRFRTDGSCVRDFSILVARAEGYEAVATSQGA